MGSIIRLRSWWRTRRDKRLARIIPPQISATVIKIRTVIPLFPTGEQGFYYLQKDSATYQIPKWKLGVGEKDWIPAIFEQEFDPTKYSDITAIYFEAIIRSGYATRTCYAVLWNVTDGVAIAGSELSQLGMTWTRKKSGDIKANMPTAAKFMSLRLKTSEVAYWGHCVSAHIIIEQDSS